MGRRQGRTWKECISWLYEWNCLRHKPTVNFWYPQKRYSQTMSGISLHSKHGCCITIIAVLWSYLQVFLYLILTRVILYFIPQLVIPMVYPIHEEKVCGNHSLRYNLVPENVQLSLYCLLFSHGTMLCKIQPQWCYLQNSHFRPDSNLRLPFSEGQVYSPVRIWIGVWIFNISVNGATATSDVHLSFLHIVIFLNDFVDYWEGRNRGVVIYFSLTNYDLLPHSLRTCEDNDIPPSKYFLRRSHC